MRFPREMFHLLGGKKETYHPCHPGTLGQGSIIVPSPPAQPCSPRVKSAPRDTKTLNRLMFYGGMVPRQGLPKGLQAGQGPGENLPPRQTLSDIDLG